MTIYDIDREIEELLNGAVDEETGELKENVAELLNALAMERDRKRENIACMIVNVTADAEGLKRQKQILEARQRRQENLAARLKSYLSEISCGEPLKTDRVSIAFRKTSHVEIDSKAQLVEWAEANGGCFLRQKEPEIDKDAVGKALKAGKEIPGASLVSGLSMTVK